MVSHCNFAGLRLSNGDCVVSPGCFRFCWNRCQNRHWLYFDGQHSQMDRTKRWLGKLIIINSFCILYLSILCYLSWRR